jgi:hypothetical protein
MSGHGRQPWRGLRSDEKVRFDREIELDVSARTPN